MDKEENVKYFYKIPMETKENGYDIREYTPVMAAFIERNSGLTLERVEGPEIS